MKIITPNEQRQLLLKMLKFIDEICRKNRIDYSLIGGSLIGAVRHQGFIPWDDDVDIVLTVKNYNRLKKILDRQTGRYRTLKKDNGGEMFGFLKLIDTKTFLVEPDQKEPNPNYGIYVDIFCYHGTSSSIKKRKAQHRKIHLYISLFSRRVINFKDFSLRQNLFRFVKNFLSMIMGYKKINRNYDKLLDKYDKEQSDYVISNWPIYDYEKEIQLRKDVNEYIDVKFEGVPVMIFKHYDNILRTTYGDYMKLPPKSERTAKHGAKVWWREDDE